MTLPTHCITWFIKVLTFISFSLNVLSKTKKHWLLLVLTLLNSHTILFHVQVVICVENRELSRRAAEETQNTYRLLKEVSGPKSLRVSHIYLITVSKAHRTLKVQIKKHTTSFNNDIYMNTESHTHSHQTYAHTYT